MRYDIGTGNDDTTKRVMADGGAVLDTTTIRDADGLAELRDQYRREGMNVDSVEDAYAQARKDWWTQVRQESVDAVEELPGESVTLSVEHDGERYETTYHVHGIAHGTDILPDFLPVSLEMEDEVRSYLRDELARFEDADEPIYVEQGFGHVLYPDEEAEVELHDVEDQKALAEERGEEFDRRFQAKMILGTTYGKMVGMQNLSMDQTVQARQMMDMQKASTRALKEADAIPDLQNAIEAFQLPYHLEEEYGEHAVRSVGPRDDGSGLLDRVIGRAKQWAAETAVDVGTDVEYRRSEIMVEEALPELFDEDVDDVRLVVGAGHQPSAVRYLEQLTEDELSGYVHGA